MADAEQLAELRSWWQFAAAAQFFQLFFGAFGMDDFETEFLEDRLLGKPPSGWLHSLHTQLLRLVSRERTINESNWLLHFSGELALRQQPDDEVFFTYDGSVEYKDLPLRTKVLILHSLCEWQFEKPENFRPVRETPEDEAVEWRVDPVGYDRDGSKYYLFDDNRLFKVPCKEQSSTKKRRGRRAAEDEDKNDASQGFADEWILVCRTASEWQTWPQQFKGSKNPDEKALYMYLTEDVVPKVVKDIKTIDEKRRLEEAMLNRKRSSRLQIREIERMEREEQEQRARGIKREASSEAASTAGRDSLPPDSPFALTKVKDAATRRKEAEERRQAELAAQEAARKALEEDRARRLQERELRAAEYREKMLLKKGKHPLGNSVTLDSPEPAAAESSPSRGATPNPKQPGAAPLNHRQEAGKHKAQDGPDPSGAEQEEPWFFDCKCGLRGHNIDDGTPIIACGKCNVWQHIACAALGRRANTSAASDTAAADAIKIEEWQTKDFVCAKCRKPRKPRTSLSPGIKGSQSGKPPAKTGAKPPSPKKRKQATPTDAHSAPTPAKMAKSEGKAKTPAFDPPRTHLPARQAPHSQQGYAHIPAPPRTSESARLPVAGMQWIVATSLAQRTQYRLPPMQHAPPLQYAQPLQHAPPLQYLQQVQYAQHQHPLAQQPHFVSSGFDAILSAAGLADHRTGGPHAGQAHDLGPGPPAAASPASGVFDLLQEAAREPAAGSAAAAAAAADAREPDLAAFFAALPAAPPAAPVPADAATDAGDATSPPPLRRQGLQQPAVLLADTPSTYNGEAVVLHPLAALGDYALASLHAQARMWFALDHPNLRRLRGACVDGSCPPFVVLEAVGSSVASLVAPQGDARAPAAAAADPRLIRIVLDVARALRYLHARAPGGPIVHGNVCPGAIFIGNDDCSPTKLGYSWSLQSKLDGQCVSVPTYLAPECSPQFEQMRPPADVYAFGMTALEILTGMPVPANPAKHVVAHEWLDPAIVGMLLSCLASSSTARPTMDSVVECLERFVEPECDLWPIIEDDSPDIDVLLAMFPDWARRSGVSAANPIPEGEAGRVLAPPDAHPTCRPRLEWSRNGRLLALRLSNCDISGQIPPDLVMFDCLEWLSLDWNDFSGTIPLDITEISRLTVLTLSMNNLQGPIPPEIGELIFLVELDLHGNCLVDEIPSSIASLTCLRKLDVSYNKLTLNLHESFGDLISLEILNLSSNRTLSLPSSFSNLSSLKWLDMSSTELEAFPTDICSLACLSWLSLQNNDIDELPASIGDMSALEYLFVDGNELAELPVELGLLKRLTTITVFPTSAICGSIHSGFSDNHIAQIPFEICSITGLREIIASENQITTIPTEIRNLAALKRLDLSLNQIATLPAGIGSLHALEYLNMSQNRLGSGDKFARAFQDRCMTMWGLAMGTALTSANANCLGRQEIARSEFDAAGAVLTNGLRHSDLSYNELELLPKELGSLAHLRKLILSHNDLAEIPSEIGDLRLLISCDVSNNRLTAIPSEIGRLSQLGFLSLANNRITQVPSSLGSLKNMAVLDLSFNQLESLPESVCAMQSLIELDVKNNPTLAALPRAIGSLNRLVCISVGNCALTSLPDEIGMLRQLAILNLASNQLTALPETIMSLAAASLTHLNLGGNTGLRLSDTERAMLKNLKMIILP
ncbi:hypothetical protein HK105_204960 [Polyrhizophydium stewartii]|uniref:non-specific serine/threonine protein kinase n=1 Tax=Polyrhizophydium stewartii TaxID=2732419 RepID=A0ABR4N7P6_9FUNG